MDELIGKGLGIWMIIQLLLYMSTTMVPMALPLGILLASIMTFGNMGENFELVAIKSAGISLLRFMRPLTIFILFICGVAFFFNNNIIPVANLKALSLLYDLRNSKPTFNLRAGQFNKDIQNYSIRIGSKDPDGRTIHNIVIYDHSQGIGNTKVVLANWGEMIPTPDKQYLIFRLHDGWRYQEDQDNVNEQTRMYFKQWDKVFDLSSFRLMRTNEDLFKGAYQMMNVAQLEDNIDSIKRSVKSLDNSVNQFVGPYFTFYSNKGEKDSLIQKMVSTGRPTRKYDSSFLELVPDTSHIKSLSLAVGSSRNIAGLLVPTINDQAVQKDNLLKFKVELNRKYTLSFACLLLFLIGAPLGAIIRKGGIGMPLVIAVSFFVVYHITSVTGEKLAKAGSVPTWFGMWMATGMLLPIAFLLIQQARNDSRIFSKEWYIRILARLKKLYSNKK